MVRKVSSLLLGVLWLGATSAVANELDGVVSTPAGRAEAVMVRTNAETRTVTAYRLNSIERSQLDRTFAASQSSDAETKRAAEAYLNLLWADASSNAGNLVAEFHRTGNELDGVSSTPSWRYRYNRGWGWNGWGGYRGGYNWNEPYYYPGSFNYSYGSYSYGYRYYGSYGGYYNTNYYYPNYGIYCYY